MGGMDKMREHAPPAVLAVLIVSLWLLASPTPSYGCSCIVPGSPSEELDKSAAVFSGEVVSVKEQSFFGTTISSTDPTTVKFAVDKVWKGTVRPDISFTTARSGASCGFTFAEGKEYIVYSRDGDTVSLCSRTKLIEDAREDLDALGAGNPPNGEASDPRDDASSSGACGMSLAASGASPDLAMLGLVVGLIWAGFRKRPR